MKYSIEKTVNQIVESTGYKQALDVVNGTWYSRPQEQKPNLELLNVLESARLSKRRIRVWYCGEDGKAWNEEFNTCGRIGRSCGNGQGEYKVPIFLQSSQSSGGCELLSHCIGKVMYTDTKSVAYQKENFHLPKFEVKAVDSGKYTHELLSDGNVYARGTEKQMNRLCDYMVGNRMGK